MLSIFDIFKIGVGPSSSHTVGPMVAAKRFIEQLVALPEFQQVDSIDVEVFGSLSLTGKGHHTDIAIIMGLAGSEPATVDIDGIPGFIAALNQSKTLLVADKPVSFSSDSIHFHTQSLPLHENAMRIHACAQGERVVSRTYYSTGGGFIAEEHELAEDSQLQHQVPFAFSSAEQLLSLCKEQGLSISALMRRNELSIGDVQRLTKSADALWNTMSEGIQRGTHTEGVLAGPLRVPRRAAALYRQLRSRSAFSKDPMDVIDWVNMFALAVSEENAAGGRVVTAPTNGAAGIIPAVMAYYDKFVEPLDSDAVARFLLSAGAIGFLYKTNASVSGAEVGCQGEVGVACSMAAAGLAELLGGSPAQVCQAAEIAMEHNLGLTCDPVAGQVQVPCIERNAIASVKAINATRMALRSTSEPRVSLDRVIDTMYATGKDMHVKYRETSQGGLAIKVVDTTYAPKCGLA